VAPWPEGGKIPLMRRRSAAEAPPQPREGVRPLAGVEATAGVEQRSKIRLRGGCKKRRLGLRVGLTPYFRTLTPILILTGADAGMGLGVGIFFVVQL